ncbi:MAG: hypothetical protein [Olavius algarvensis Delta 4 endosymbiont]|nr:MAG: hypothetical protein [Olavius algarvensis Delta 4 endosymbiont]
MLDIDPAKLKNPTDVKDVLPETCTMVAGSLNSSLCDAGFNCQIAPVTFTLARISTWKASTWVGRRRMLIPMLPEYFGCLWN